MGTYGRSRENSAQLLRNKVKQGCCQVGMPSLGSSEYVGTPKALTSLVLHQEHGESVKSFFFMQQERETKPQPKPDNNSSNISRCTRNAINFRYLHAMPCELKPQILQNCEAGSSVPPSGWKPCRSVPGYSPAKSRT